MFYRLANLFGIYMKKLVNIMRIVHPTNQATIETQMILTLPQLIDGSPTKNLLAPVAITIEFPETWSTAWITHVTKLEFLLECLVVSDVNNGTSELEENPVQVILRDTLVT